MTPPLTIRQFCEKATPGPWLTSQNEDSRPPMHSDWRVHREGSTADRIAPIARMELRGKEAEFNAQLIARLSPDVVLKVVNLMERANDMHLGRCASSEPFKASDYRDHACAARLLIKEALRLLNATALPSEPK